ncbi:hypothetical protein N9C66_01220 [Akkermansiaceae bacterium]|nr:hypothetical protein [Akkermansiaceae bacterium]MDA7933646.1 hypothetical protein [Akkermansiaceae bacterium]MDA9829935.1 hypothetical protein [Akkermansiaceae bacterium]MDB4369827.1 hypothetical protein [Akkermansiaceae bacterium]MDB4488685.1 hypothetical protein [Akkermansiaceae bacterium]
MKILLRGVAIFFALWGVVLLLARWLEVNPFWPAWVIPLIGALGAELVFWCYRYERTAISPQRGWILLGLRLAELGLLLWILLQPVWSRFVQREIEREVIVMIDDSASMDLVDDGQTKSRLELAREQFDASGLLDELDGRVGVREVRAARRALLDESVEVEGWDQATDLAGGLEAVLDQVPPDQLAGVVLLSDGRHNRPGSVEDVSRRFGILDAPIAVIPSGSDVPPKDAAIISVRSPDSVYLGDRIRVGALLKFDGYRGKKAKLQLFAGDKELETREISIPQDNYREEVKFRHAPEEGGVGEYRVVLSGLEDETFENNNEWGFQTVVSDARTNVLLIDRHPRWEFRYLRNLFYGRDQSIHLQSVLLEPDRISGHTPPKVVASASRPFGEANATHLPETEEEWRKFDVIIVGDIGPDSLSDQQWSILKGCVSERAALLVLVAGPEYMPHSFDSEVARELIPVKYEASRRTFYGGDEEFRFALTNTGRNHPITAQVEGQMSNERLWKEFPVIRWRHPVEGLQPGAEVLLHAEEADVMKRKVDSAASLDAALSEVASRREREAGNALLVTRQTGAGKVAMLLADRTWRLREGVGDIYHHRFWGQLVRWGAGPNLRAGNEKIRLGTDQLTYTGDDRVQIMTRLRDGDLNPVVDQNLIAEVTHESGEVTQVPLKYRENSNGIHESLAGPFREPGLYEVKVRDEVITSFRVVGARSAIELSETTLNQPLLDSIAKMSGGRVFEGEGALADLFLKGDETRTELRETSLWDIWPVLLLLAILLTAEWVIRRRGGLS